MVLIILLLNSYLRSDKKKKEERDNLYCEFVERLKKENDEKPLLNFTLKKSKFEPLIKIINTTEIQQMLFVEQELKSYINNLMIIHPQIKLVKLDHLISH
jgi:hypothetical protein